MATANQTAELFPCQKRPAQRLPGHRYRRAQFSAQDFPVAPMKKEQIVEVLETIATLLELQEENPFKIRAYTNAARSIETWGGNLREMAEENRLEEIPGVGKAIAGKITELALTGSSKFYDELRGQISPRHPRTVFPPRPWCEKD